jgi:hypothetical protein
MKNAYIIITFFWFCSPARAMAPFVSRGFVITHNDAAQAVKLLWTSNQPDAETSIWQHTIHKTGTHPCPRWDLNPRSQQVSGRRPKALDSAATGIGVCVYMYILYKTDTIFKHKTYQYIKKNEHDSRSVNANFVSVKLSAVSQARLHKHNHKFHQSFHKSSGTVSLFRPRSFLPIFSN